MEKLLSIALVVRRWPRCSAGMSSKANPTCPALEILARAVTQANLLILLPCFSLSRTMTFGPNPLGQRPPATPVVPRRDSRSRCHFRESHGINTSIDRLLRSWGGVLADVTITRYQRADTCPVPAAAVLSRWTTRTTNRKTCHGGPQLGKTMEPCYVGNEQVVREAKNIGRCRFGLVSPVSDREQPSDRLSFSAHGPPTC